ncbi:MAG: hypothetical protein COZ09_14315 [Comamonadaceae bacterium CG_4_10_14_3_um_filter_60_42]|nr:MAG: hypothetical protein AUK51_01545 [Comamonadaceae bacterium CG2_30_59_20]PIY27594.1 MAG: hypothetical protein COZ09_14315 [Comamonadaceae bacterium CG_4_10_14_3_um_filter_60_42]
MNQPKDKKMSRLSDKLEIFRNKLSQRYGPGDTLCKQVSAALESCRKFEPVSVKKHDWSVPYTHTIAAYRLDASQANRR